MKRTGLAVLLAVVMMLGSMPMAFADETADIAAAGGVVEFENYAEANRIYVAENANASGGSVAYIWTKKQGYPGGVEVDELFVRASFTAAAAGWYDFQIDACCNGAEADRSQLFVSLNDEPEVEINEPNFLWNEPAQPITTPYVVRCFTSSKQVYLKEGENTIAFRVPKRLPAKDGIIFVLDCAKFTKAPTGTTQQTIAAAGGKLEFEGIADGDSQMYQIPHNNASGGILIGTRSDNFSNYHAKRITGTFTAETTGWYDVQISASCLGREGARSPLFVSVNGSPVGELTAPNYFWNDPAAGISGSFATNLAPVPYTVTNFTGIQPVYLEAGENVISVSAAGREADYGGLVIFALDCVSFTPSATQTHEQVISANGGTIEFEAYATDNDLENGEYPNASNGRMAVYLKDQMSKVVFTAFEAEQAGWYNLRIATANSGRPDTGHLSPMYLSLNREAPVAMTTAAFDVRDGAQTVDNTYLVTNFTYYAPVYLEAGCNTMIFAAPRRQNNDIVVFALDCAEFTPAKLELGAVAVTGDTSEDKTVTIRLSNAALLPDEPCQMVFAAYDSEYQLVDVYLTTDVAQTVSAVMDLTDAKTVRAFLWKSGILEPICESAQLDLF